MRDADDLGWEFVEHLINDYVPRPPLEPVAAINRYTEFEVEHYVDSWAIFGKGSDYPIAQGGKADMEIIATLLSTRVKDADLLA